MSFRSVAAKNAVLRIVGVLTVAAAALVSASGSSAPITRAQSVQRGALPRATSPKVRLPDEAAGIDGVVGALISVYDQFDVVAFGEAHGRRLDSDLRIALVRHPDFARKVRSIVVEFATTTEQTTLDRYIRGENVTRAQLKRVGPTEFGSVVWESAVYEDFFAAVREVNATLPADARIRVFGAEDNRKVRDFDNGNLVYLNGGSVFKGSTLTLGQMADACVYFGKP